MSRDRDDLPGAKLERPLVPFKIEPATLAMMGEEKVRRGKRIAYFKAWHRELDTHGARQSERVRMGGGPKEGDLVAVEGTKAIMVITWEDFLAWHPRRR